MKVTQKINEIMVGVAQLGEWRQPRTTGQDDRAGDKRYANSEAWMPGTGINNGGRSSVGRAPGCDPGRRGFESHRPPQIRPHRNYRDKGNRGFILSPQTKGVTS